MVKRGRVGIAIAGKTACVVLVCAGETVWQQTATLTTADDWAAVVLSLLAALPPERRRPLSVRLSLGFPYACCKRLFGVAQDASIEAVNLALISDPGSFFVGDEASYITSAAGRIDGHWCAGTLDRQMVDAVVAATNLSHIPFCGSIPSEQRDEQSGLIAAATAVASIEHNAPLLVDPLSRARKDNRQRRIRVALSGVLVVTTVFALCAAGIATRWKVSQGKVALVEAENAYQQQVADAGVPATVRDALTDASVLSAESEELILLVHRLAAALPDSAAFLSVKIDSVEGLVVIASRAASSPLREFAQIEGLSRPHLLGSMTRSEVAGIPVTRSTLSFRRNSAGQHRDDVSRLP